MKLIAVIGRGGHSKVVQDVIRAMDEYQLIALLDDKYIKPDHKDGIIFAPINHAFELMKAEEEIHFVIAIGSNHIRKQIAERLEAKGARFAVLVHPSAVVSSSVIIQEGTVVMPKAVINAEAIIGKHVIVNTASIIEHDNHIGDFAHISPSSTLTGGVAIGEGVHIGAGAVVIPGKSVGAWSIVGAGGVVTDNLPEEITAVGVPTRIM